MDKTAPDAPASWLEILAESEAQIAAGQVVSGDVVRQRLRDSIARLEAKQTAKPRPGKTARR
jgi:hypothetical protein